MDKQENRIYLSAASTGCLTPNRVRLTETDSSIEITVTGLNCGEPCTMQHVALLGYVQLDSIGQRQIRGNTTKPRIQVGQGLLRRADAWPLKWISHVYESNFRGPVQSAGPSFLSSLRTLARFAGL